MKIKRNIPLLAIFNFLNDFRFYTPIAIIYFSSITNSFGRGMSIFAIAQIASAIFEIPTGIFSDLIGRRKTVIIGAICSFVSVFFYTTANNYSYLIIGAIVEGLSRSFFSGNNDGLLYDTLAITKKEDEYKDFLGKVKAPFQLALAGSALVGGLVATVSLKFAFLLTLLPQFGTLIIASYLIEPTRHVS